MTTINYESIDRPLKKNIYIDTYGIAAWTDGSHLRNELKEGNSLCWQTDGCARNRNVGCLDNRRGRETQTTLSLFFFALLPSSVYLINVAWRNQRKNHVFTCKKIKFKKKNPFIYWPWKHHVPNCGKRELI